MSEHKHHHHHHHHYEDEATAFKRKSLLSVKRRKALAKYGFMALCAVAVLMAIATIMVYKLT